MIFVLVAILFGLVNSLEFISFYSRIAGKLINKTATGYAYQNIILTVSRFSFFFMMPLLGYLIDIKIESNKYLIMVLGALVVASTISFISMLKSSWIISKVISKIDSSFNINYENISFDLSKFDWKIFAVSLVVNFCYSMSFFIMYYIALNFYNYRSSIGNVAAAINGVATILTSFYVEPKISKEMDSGTIETTKSMITTYLAGRLFAISIMGPALVIVTYLLNNL